MAVGLIVWLIFFFDAFLPFLLMLGVGGALGAFLVYRSRSRNGGKDRAAYLEAKQEYDAYRKSLADRSARNRPEILWDTARREPCDF